jgi:predicted nucleotidyltransferase
MPDANRLEEYKKIIIPVLKDNDVEKAGLFGSFARGDTGKDSDIDILIRFKGRKTLLDLVGVKQELEEKTKRKVDVVTYKSLHPLLKDRILKEEVELYEER